MTIDDHDEFLSELSEVNGELFDAKSKSEEESAARAAEIEMIELDLERASQVFNHRK